jgi:hypothetical protein
MMAGASMGWRLGVAVVSCAVMAIGCGSLWERGAHAGTSEAILQTTTSEQPAEDLQAEVTQDGVNVDVRATHLCDEVEVHRVERTDRHHRQSRVGGWMIFSGVAGLAAGGGGGYLLATAHDRPEETPPGSDEMTRRQALGLGAASVAAGGAAVLAALVHWAIVSKKDKRRKTLEEAGDVVAHGVACTRPVAAGGVDVRVAAGANRFRAGTTDDAGRLGVDLANVVPRQAVVGSSWPKRANVVADGQVVGSVALAPLREWHDRKAWSEVDPEACAAPRTSDDCGAVRAYLAAFPKGEHAEEAKGLMDQARAALERIAEREEMERRAEAERQQRLEEERRAAAERERLEAERRRQEIEASRRAEEARYQRELERRGRAEKEARQKAAKEKETRRQKAAARRKCQAKCRSSCAGNRECVEECVRSQCP